MFSSIFKISSFFVKGAATPAAPVDREQEIRAIMAEFEQDSFPITSDEEVNPAIPSQLEKEITQTTTNKTYRTQRKQPAAVLSSLTHSLAHLKGHSSVVVQGGRLALKELYKVATAPVRIALSPMITVAAMANVPIKLGNNTLRTHYLMFGPMSVTYRYF